MEITRVGVLGAGVMGSGIAQVAAQAGLDAVCYDPDDAALASARDQTVSGRYGIERAVERGKLTADQGAAAQRRLRFTESFDEAADTQLVVEAVPERLDLKVRVFRELDRVAPPETILASNTSGFPVAAVSAATERPERVLAWHWASPAPVMRFAEIVRGPSTTDDTVDAVVEVATRCGKNPVVVNDAPNAWGFVANRVYFAAIREAEQIVREGVATPDQVNQLLVDCYRWPVGPLAMVAGATGGWDEGSAQGG